MKSMKFFVVLCIVLASAVNNANAQKYAFIEEWTDYYLWTDCLPEVLIGTLTMEVKISSPTNMRCKGGGTLYGEITNEPYEVKLVNPGWFSWTDIKGLDWTFVNVFHILKDGKLVCVAQRTTIVRSVVNADAELEFHLFKGHEIYNCK